MGRNTDCIGFFRGKKHPDDDGQTLVAAPAGPHFEHSHPAYPLYRGFSAAGRYECKQSASAGHLPECRLIMLMIGPERMDNALNHRVIRESIRNFKCTHHAAFETLGKGTHTPNQQPCLMRIHDAAEEQPFGLPYCGYAFA